jgi:hypothetical protein
MKVEIKHFDCADLDDADIATWQPACPEDVYLGFTLSIGPVDEVGSEYFQIVVTTPQAMQRRKKWKSSQGKPKRRHSKLLVVQEHNWEQIHETLERMVAECEIHLHLIPGILASDSA